jgi:hypothetical protein
MATQRKPKSRTRYVLSFLTADEAGIRLARDYWSGYDDGGKWTWAETVQSIADRSDIPKHLVPATVRRHARALHPNLRCSECSEPIEIECRSSWWAHASGTFACSKCQTELLRLEKQKVQLEEQKHREQEFVLTAQQAAIVHRESSRNSAVDCGTIDYLDAVLLFAIMLASDSACEIGRFDGIHNFHLCASNKLTGDILNRLLTARLLQLSPDTPPDALVLGKAGAWSYYPQKVKWCVSPDANGDPYPKLFAKIGRLIDVREQHPQYEECVKDLWWLLGFDDALSFLDQEVATYRISNYRRGPKTEEAVRYALQRLPIPQVRRVIRNVVKNAAALSVRGDFSGRHAMNTIPGGVISYVDRASSEKWTIYPVLKTWNIEEPVLTTVLFDRVMDSGAIGFKGTTGEMLGDSTLQIG